MENLKIEEADIEDQAILNDLLDVTTNVNIQFTGGKINLDSIKVEPDELSANKVYIKNETWQEPVLEIRHEDIKIEPDSKEDLARFARPEKPDPSVICPDCAFKARNKNHLRTHRLSHLNPDKLKMYTCDHCAYTSRSITDVKRHRLTHLKPEEIDFYHCEACPYKAKSLSELKQHCKRVHTKSEGETWYKCDQCDHQTKHKDYLRKHISRHTNNRKVYKCPLCPFETFYRSNLLLSHQLTHKSEAEVRIHQCEICPYKATTKNHLTTHMKLKHLNPDEVKIYNCERCTYTSRNIYDVKRHSRTHLKPEEINFHYCSHCNYKSKTEYGVKQHFKRVHTKERKWYKCDQCSLQFTQQRFLNKHMICHKDPEQANSTEPVLLFYCLHCPYHTKNKDHLKRHVLIHSNKYRRCDVKISNETLIKQEPVLIKEEPTLIKEEPTLNSL